MEQELISWTQAVQQKFQQSNINNLALAIEVVNGQKIAVIIEPKEQTFDEKKFNLITYCQNKQVLAVVWITQDLGTRQTYRKIFNDDFKLF